MQNASSDGKLVGAQQQNKDHKDRMQRLQEHKDIVTEAKWHTYADSGMQQQKAQAVTDKQIKQHE